MVPKNSGGISEIDGASPGKIFIVGLAKETTSDAFTKYFEKYGEVIDSVIMKDRNTGLPRGFGFITYDAPSVVDTVIREDHVINDKHPARRSVMVCDIVFYDVPSVRILPADSEHSAIFQCIQGLTEGSLRRLILTASGGSFRDWPFEKLKEVTVAEALKHPNWSLGKKVTVDSATMFSKALEVIEAHYLFGVDYENIEVIIHLEAIIHSMIETQDSSVIGQLGIPDMRIPLLYTLSWPDRIYCSEVTWPRLDLCQLGKLTFRAPDKKKYPSLDMGYAAGRAGDYSGHISSLKIK